MKRNIYWLFLVFALILSACASANPPVTTIDPADLPASEADVPRISVEDAKAAYERGEAIIVDVRAAEYYAGGHIAGAISIPLVRIESDPAGVSLEKAKWIITYCT